MTRHFGKSKASRNGSGKVSGKRGAKAAPAPQQTPLETAARMAGRVDFEMIEARVLLSADINPALGAAALDLGGEDVAQIIAAKLQAEAAAPVLEIADSAAPIGTGVDLSALDLTFLDRAAVVIPGSRVDIATTGADLDETTVEAIFTEELEGGQSVALSLRSDGDLSLRVELRDPDGVVIATLEAGETVGLPVPLPATGVYTLSLQRLAGAGHADVSLVLNAVVEAEAPGTSANDDFTTAESLTPSALAFGADARQLAAFGTVDLDSPDTWSFDLAEGDVLTLISTLNVSAAPQVAVYAQDGRQLALGADNMGPYALIDSLSVRAEDAGTVYVVIRGEGSYALTGLVNAKYMNPIVADEPRDLTDTGLAQGEIDYGQDTGGGGGGETYLNLEENEGGDIGGTGAYIEGPQQGNRLTVEGYGYIGNNELGEQADRDFITIDMMSGGELTLQVSGQIEGIVPRITVFDTLGNEIASADAYEGSANVSILSEFPGTYYVAISAADDQGFNAFEHDGTAPFASGSYTLYFSLVGGSGGPILSDLTTVEPDDTLANATALDLPLFANGTTTVQGAIGDANGAADRDMYSIFLRAGDQISGVVLAARAGTGLDPMLALFNSAGTRLSYNDDSNGLDSQLSFTADANGYYYFGISSYSNINYNPTLPAGGNGAGGSTGSYEITFTVTRNLSAANASLYQVQANAGDVLVLRTSTPGDAAGLPENGLDPAVALYGPDGALLASNSNDAADGRNAELTYTVTEAGTYLIEVLAEGGNGIYRLEVEGATGVYSRAPQLIGTSLSTEEVLSVAPDHVEVYFDTALYGGDLRGDLLSVDGVAAHGVTQVASSILRFDITGLLSGDGSHTFELGGGITSLPGYGAEGFSWSIQTDFTAPEIASATPAAGTRVAPGLEVIEITFTEPLSLGLASLSDFVLRDVLTGRPVVLDSLEVVDMTTLRLRIAEPLPEGLLRVEINTAAPAMVDRVGNALVGGTLTFGVDRDVIAVDDAFEIASPVALAAYVADLAGALDQDGDTDTHSFTLGAGNRALVVATVDPGVIAEIRLEDATGAVLWQGTTDGSGAALRMPQGLALAAGDYRLVVAGQTGAGLYSVSILLNAELEAEATGGADNATAAEALDTLVRSFAGIETWTMAGELATPTDADSYDFALSAGERISFLISAQTNFAAAVDIYDPAGTFVGRATQMDDGTLRIDALVAAQDGRYRLVVRSENDGAGRYVLGAVQGAVLETENADLGPRVIAGGTPVLGGLGERAGEIGSLRIAVVHGSGSPTAGYPRTAAQLNDTTRFSFDAVVVAPTGIDSLAELSQYDVVVIGNDGYGTSSGDQFGVYASALAAWVEAGGAVVMTGWGAYGSNGESSATLTALNSFSPVVLGSGYSYTSVFTPNQTEHPVTDGVASFSVNYVEYPSGGLANGAVALATSGGAITAAVKSTGAGRAVYLGPSYVMRDAYAYTTGSADQLLEQAVEWAGQSYTDHSDAYYVDLAAGETLSIETLTPHEASGLPGGLADLRIQLFDANGLLVAQNNDGAADGRNALMTFTPGSSNAGRFRVVIGREASSDVHAQYVLQVSGGTETRRFEVAAADPGLNGATVTIPDAIVIEFSQAVRPDSIDLSDLVIDGGAVVTSAELLDGNSVRFGLTLESVDRTYSWSLAEGALTALDGTTLVAASSSFHVDLTAPWVESVSPSPQASRPFTSLSFTFDEPIDPGSVSIADLQGFTGPDGANLIGTVQSLTVSGSVLTVTFSERTLHGTYRLVLGSQITDIAGNPMQDPVTGATTFTAEVDLISPDFAVTLAAPSTELRFGEAFDVTYTVTNIGQDPAQGSWQDRIVLRNTAGTIIWNGPVTVRPSTSDQGNPIPPMEVGDSYTRTVPVTLPLTYGFAEGSYILDIVSDYYGNVAEVSEANNSSPIAVTVTYPPTPDLQVANFTVPAGAVSGQTMVLSWVVQNTGAAPASNWYDRVYLSTDGTLGGDTLLGSYTYSGTLAAGASVTRTQTVTLPATIEGTFRLIVVTDYGNQVFEGIAGAENNNATASDNSVLVTLQPFPNMIVSDIIVPEAAASSQPITVQWDVSNTGTGATGSTNWYDLVYLSLDEVLGNEDDVYLGRSLNPSYLAVGESYRNSLTATLPVGIEGTYYIGVRTDGYDHILEFGNEGDNTRISGPVAVALTPPADLQVTNVVSPAQAFSGQRAQVSWTVTNAGQGATLETGWYDRVYLSLDGTLSGDDIDLGYVYHSGRLAAGASYTVNHSVTLPVGVSGDFVMIVQTDTWNNVYEFIFEDNNTGTDIDDTGAPDVTRVLLTPPPDLVLELVSVPDPMISGRAQRITYQVFNDGATATPNTYWTDRFYLSSDAVLDASDQLLASASRNGRLNSGESYAGAVNVTLPDGLLGDYYLIGLTDAGATVFELNRTNNVDATRINAAISAADLVMTSFTTPETGIAGGAINVSWSVANQGEGDTATNAWGDHVVLSSDAIYGNGDDVELLIRPAGLGTALAAGGSYGVSNVTVALPVGLTAGTWYLFAATDARSMVFESGRESNNVSAARTIEVTRRSPDLIPGAVTLVGATADGNLSATAGRNMQVRYTVTNTAAAATERTNWNDGIYLVRADGTGTAELLGRVYRSNRLEAGASYTQTATVFLPLDALAGEYRIEVQTDIGNVVIEDGAEDNNIAASAGVLNLAAYAGGPIDTPPDGSDPFAALTPNLTVSGVDFTGGQWAGGQIEVTWTIENDGPQTTANQTWYDQVYLSLDDQFDEGTDISLGYVAHTTLAAGESYQVTRSFTIPRNIAGAYHVILVTDSSRRVAELNETDNLRVADTTVTIAVPPPADLVVGTITVPETGETGQPVSITYTATNAGTNAAVGQWTDRLYLSADGVWDLNDAYIGQLSIAGPVAAGASYTRTLTAALPGVLPGTYQVVVRSDIYNALQESDETNNSGVSDDQIAADAPVLVLGTAANGSVEANGGVYYKVSLTAGDAVRISVDRNASAGATELYASFGAIPNRTTYDFAALAPFETDQSLLIPVETSGDYYIFIRSQTGSTTTYSVLAEVIPFSLGAAVPGAVSNTGASTLEITGARFREDTDFALVGADGTVIEAEAVTLDSSVRAYVRFNLNGAAVGNWTLRATNGDSSVTLETPVVVSDTLVSGRVDVTLSGPPTVRPDRLNIVQVNYANVGGTDVGAPLIILSSSTGTPMGLSVGSVQKTDLQILGLDPSGLNDILRAGASSSISVLFRSGTVEQGVRISARAVTESDTTRIEDWSVIEAALRPADLTDAEWAGFWQRVQPRIGETWGQYVRVLNTLSRLLAADGLESRDLRTMMRSVYDNLNDYLPSVSFAGQLVDSASGAAAEGVVVQAYLVTDRGLELRGTSVSAADGSFGFGSLEPGSYQFFIDTSGVGNAAYYQFDMNTDGVADLLPLIVVMPSDRDVSGVTISVTRVEPEVVPPSARQPLVANDAAGRLHMVWWQDDALVHSVNDGTGWTAARTIAGVANATDLAFVIDPRLIGGATEGLMLSWTAGDGNETEVYYAIGQRNEAGAYLWSAPTALTADSAMETGLSVGVGADGKAVFLYGKDDADSDTDDVDLYSQSLAVQASAYPMDVFFQVDDVDLFVQYLESLSDEQLEALATLRLRYGLTLNSSKVVEISGRVDVTVRYDEKEASAAINGAINGKIKIGSGAVEGEVRVGGEAGWYVDPDTCQWKFDWGILNIRLGVAADIPFRLVLSLFGPAGGFVGSILDTAGFSARVEGLVSGEFNYNSTSELPFSPSSSKGTGQVAFGASFKHAQDWWFFKTEATIRLLGRVHFGFGPGFSVSLKEPYVSGSLLVRMKYEYPGQKPFFEEVTYSVPSGSALSVGVLPYNVIDLSVGEIVTLAEEPDMTPEIERTFYRGETTGGSLTDLSGENETAVTRSLTTESSGVIAETADGVLRGAWIANDGIVVAGHDGSGWTGQSIAAAAGSFTYSNLALGYDGQGDGILVWNRSDLSDLEGVTSYEQFKEVVGRGGELVYSVYDRTTGTWSEQAVLQSVTGFEHDLRMTRLENGDVVASWLVSAGLDSDQGSVWAATWNAATNSWSTPVELAQGKIADSPAVAVVAGTPVVIWSQGHAVETSEQTGFELRSARLVDGAWTVDGAVALPTAAAALEAEAEADVPLESLWNIISLLPTPDQEDCECKEGEDCDDDYDPDVQRPSDPNDIIGPVGAGELNWVTTEAPYGYTIRFENEPTATAAAQVVTITQQLDSDLNWNSFRIDDFGWGDLVFEVDATSPFYTNRFDFVADHGFYVDVTASVDITTGIATWTLSTIDPATGEPPLEAALGFLPVNDETGRGEGFVSYTIAAPRTARSGDRIDAVARIVFDTESPIDTPPIFNTLDRTAPTSSVEALPTRTETPEFLVRWASADDEGGSSVSSVSVYVSVDGGAWTLWLENTTLSEAVYVGEGGHSYAFYSVARDVAGWLEAAPQSADATILVGEQPGQIAGVVFADSDGDGVQDAGEAGQANVIVYLDLDGNGDLDPSDYAVLTGSDGSYLFEGLEPGSYRLLTDLPSGVIVTGPGAGGASVEVLADTVAAGPALGLFERVSLSGTVFRDGLGATDGVRDGAEPALAGWTVFLDADGDAELDAGEISTVTDLSGTFRFDDLGPGSVTLRAVALAGYVGTLPTDGGYPIALSSGLARGGLDFGFRLLPASIGGIKFEDVNGNGQRDAGEAGLAGWTVFLDADGDGALDANERSTVTGADGTYVFEGLAPGSYIVAEVAQAGWVQTFPGPGPFAVGTHVITTSALDIALQSPAVPLAASQLDSLAAAGAGWDDTLTGLDDFRADTRFDDITGSRTTVVTIDTGIDLDHGFFGPDADGNGVSDRIVFSYDFADGDADASDRTGHGTGIAGIIGGADQTYGGLAPEVDLISLKVFRDSGAGYFSQLERALQWVVLNAGDYGVGVVNLSLGDGGNWGEAVSRYGLGDELAALADMGIIVIAATGNSYASFDTEGVAYPAADPNVIGVGAVWAGDYGGPWYFSNGATDYTTGSDRITSFTQRDRDLLDILAPGAQLVTAGLDGGLAAVQGTSHAAAYMSGVAALAQDLALREFGKQLSAAQFSALLSQTAVFVVDGDDERDNVVNTGLSFPRVDIVALAEAILALDPASFDEPVTVEPVDPGTGGAPLQSSAGTHSVTVAAGDTVADVNFGGFEKIALSGTIYDDADGNGQRDAGEGGVEGVTVFVDTDGDGLRDETENFALTDADGAYTLTGVGPGPVRLAVIAPEGAGEVAPVQIATLSGADQGGIDFGLEFGPTLPVSLTVTAVTPATDGFAVRFNQQIDTSAMGAGGALSAIELRNAAGQVVRGTVIFDADGMGLRFIATGAALRDTSYSLRLSAGTGGFAAETGALDGNADGTGGDDFVTTFAGPAGGTAILSIGEIARAAGQSLAHPTVRPGMAISLSGAAGLTRIAFRLDFDAGVFDITGLQIASGLPAGSTLSLIELAEGGLRAVLTLGSPLASNAVLTVGYLIGSISASAPSGAVGLLDLTVTEVTGVALAQADDGLAVVQMVGDLDGDGVYTSADYQMMLAASLGNVAGGGMVDYTVLADMDGNGTITVADRTLLFRAARGVISPQVPVPPVPTNNTAVAPASASATGGMVTGRTAAPVAAATPTAPPAPVTPVASQPASVTAPAGSGLIDLSAQASNFGLSAASGSALTTPKTTSLLAARRALM